MSESSDDSATIEYIEEFKDFCMVDNCSQTSNAEDEAMVDESEDKGKILRCPYDECDATYVRPYMMNQHIDKKHNGG